MRRLVLALVLAAVACGPYDTPTTERYKAMVHACERIRDEHERSECLQHVPARP